MVSYGVLRCLTVPYGVLRRPSASSVTPGPVCLITVPDRTWSYVTRPDRTRPYLTGPDLEMCVYNHP